MNTVIVTQREAFRNMIVEKLGLFPIDYEERWLQIQSSQKTNEPFSAAGVLLLLYFREGSSPSQNEGGEYCFHLIKRSTQVAQPGDLSCPGGMLSPKMDGALRPLIATGFPPVLRGPAKAFARLRTAAAFNTLTLFLANAVREAWEEIRLSPFNLDFLGPLPCHSLILFKRTIFPLVGLVEREPFYQLNSEAEKLVEIPLSAFFQTDNYAFYQIETGESLKNRDHTSWQFTCFLHQEEGRPPEILWGATFYIILKFLEILFDFKMPEVHSGRVFQRTLHDTYLTGAR